MKYQINGHKEKLFTFNPYLFIYAYTIYAYTQFFPNVPIKSFVFGNGLMQELFNENYLESDKYPFVTFKGKINESIGWAKAGTYPVSATGKLNVHGVERDQTIKGKLDVGSRKVQLDAGFTVALADYRIEIPTLVLQKIAETITVTTRFVYEPHVKQ